MTGASLTAFSLIPPRASPTAPDALILGAWLAAGIVIIAWLLARLPAMTARRGLDRKTRRAVHRHLQPLIRRKAQLVQIDAYGRAQTERWDKELAYFVTHHIAPGLSRGEQLALHRESSHAMALIDNLIESEMDRQPVGHAFSNDMTPAAFEVFCAAALREAGWQAQVTGQSRDQGVDVIAAKGDMRVVLQCKLYARPVGNKSVQEAAAARMHERADYAAVVTNRNYTQAAEQLAATNGVLLLHYRDLPALESMLGRARQLRPAR